MGFLRFFKLFFIFIFFQKFSTISVIGGGVRPNVEFYTFFLTGSLIVELFISVCSGRIQTFCRLIILMLRKTLLPSLDTGLWLSCRDWILSGRGNTGREVREELCNVENTVRNKIQFSFPKSLLVYADCTVLVFMLNSYNIFNTQQ